jgi:hypothetical protein
LRGIRSPGNAQSKVLFDFPSSISLPFTPAPVVLMLASMGINDGSESKDWMDLLTDEERGTLLQ